MPLLSLLEKPQRELVSQGTEKQGMHRSSITTSLIAALLHAGSQSPEPENLPDEVRQPLGSESNQAVEILDEIMQMVVYI